MAQFDEILSDELDCYGREGTRTELSVEALRVPLNALDVAKAETLPLGSTVDQVLRLIQQPGTSCVVITNGEGKLVGLITERDLCTRVTANGLDPKSTAVDDVMTRNPLTLRADEPLTFALGQMDIGGYRHVPLVDDDGRPAGVVTARRVINYIVEFFPEEVKVLPPSPVREGPEERHGG
ncbi:MAG: CBS domain-containing protein [Candidatus Krumholzibacteriia bacterium]